MINNSALSSSMNVADLAPKAATKQLSARQGDNAFGEALAGAHTVHDRRESQAADNARRDWAQGDRSTERTRGQDRAGDVRSDAADRAERSDRTGDDVEAPANDALADTTDTTATTDDTSATTTTQTTDTSDDATTATVEAGTDTDAAAAAAQATVAVAAAPVVADLDAIIVPTSTTVTQVATDAVDAAIRLAIDPAAAATTTDTAATTVAATTTATVAATDGDVDAQLAAAANALGAEDAETGDVLAGPTRPTTSAPATTSGPSPVQLAAATFPADEAAKTTAQVAQVATSDAVNVAAGTTTDAAATQLVQAVAVDADADADASPVAETVIADDAVALKAKTDGAATQVAAKVEPELVEAEDAEVVQAARLNQGQAPTVAVNAQVQAQAAKAAEQAAEEGSDAAPAKLEPLPTQAAPVATTARGEGMGAALRMREGLQAQVQERIDHIAEQLATRLRLSQAAGGSQVQLSLKPRELGEVTVQMNVREGAVAATILVDKADTLRTLQTNIEDLKKSLESQGLQIGEFSVDVRGDSGAGGANARAAADLRDAAARTSNGASASLAGAAAVTPGLSGDREVAPEDVHDGDVSVLA